jgi:hypothetical protein
MKRVPEVRSEPPALSIFRMPVHSIVEVADCPAAKQLLLTIGRAGVLSAESLPQEA